MSAARGGFACAGLYLIVLLAGCQSAPPASPQAQAPRAATSSRRLRAPDQASAAAVSYLALSLVGTPYRYGGTDPNGGFDCSGLVQYVFRFAAERSLPRTVAEQNRMQLPQVGPAQLFAGDLLFFETGEGPSHIGIYLSGDRFVHAPRTGGTVRIESLKTRYWQQRFLTAKRVL